MKNTAVARRYAQALILLGKEDGNAEKYGIELKSFALLTKSNNEFLATLSNPLFELEARRQVLVKVMAKFNFSKTTQTFLNFLFIKGRIIFIIEINDFYQKFVDEIKGIVRASLISAQKLEESSVNKISEALAKKIGKKIILDVKQDESIIGGVITKIGDLVLDGSIKTQLLKMKESF